MSDVKLGLIPIYIEAPSKSELIKKMLTNNYINQMKFNYMSPYKSGKVYEVWFYADVEDYKHPDDLEFDGAKKVRFDK